jgi:PH (Pleckstrin Homology) domain-containing protein
LAALNRPTVGRIDQNDGVATILRPAKWQRGISTIACVAASAVATTIAVTSPHDFLLPMWIVIAVVAPVAAVRLWSLRVEVHPEKLLLVNWIRTHDLPWASVSRCTADSDGLLIHLADGAGLRASAFHHNYRAHESSRRQSRAVAVQLERARRQRHRGATRP